MYLIHVGRVHEKYHFSHKEMTKKALTIGEPVWCIGYSVGLRLGRSFFQLPLSPGPIALSQPNLLRGLLYGLCGKKALLYMPPHGHWKKGRTEM